MTTEQENLDETVEPATITEDEQANEDPENPDVAPLQDEPKPKKEFTKKERLLHARNKIDEQLSEVDNEEDDNKPLTLGDLKRIKREETRETAINLANSIEDEDERTEVQDILRNNIVPSGDPKKDLAIAQGAVNSIKNAQIAEEAERKRHPERFPNAPGNPAKPVEGVFEPTLHEATMMRNYKLTKEDILAARARSEARRK